MFLILWFGLKTIYITYFSLIDISGFNRFLSFFYWMVSDEELLFNIPFTGNIKLKGLIIMGGSHGHHPSKVKLFKNRPHMTLCDAQSKSDQVCSVYLLIQGSGRSGKSWSQTSPPETLAPWTLAPQALQNMSYEVIFSKFWLWAPMVNGTT